MTDDNGQPTNPNHAPITTNPPGSIAWAEKYLADHTYDAVDRPLDPQRDFGTRALAIVAEHLQFLGYLEPEPDFHPGVTPIDIAQAVKRFQQDVGIDRDGFYEGDVGPRTLSWLEIHAAIRTYDEINDPDDEEPAPAVEAPTVADTAPMAPAVDMKKDARDLSRILAFLAVIFITTVALVDYFGAVFGRELSSSIAAAFSLLYIRHAALDLYATLQGEERKPMLGLYDLTTIGIFVGLPLIAWVCASVFGVSTLIANVSVTGIALGTYIAYKFVRYIRNKLALLFAKKAR